MLDARDWQFLFISGYASLRVTALPPPRRSYLHFSIGFRLLRRPCLRCPTRSLLFSPGPVPSPAIPFLVRARGGELEICSGDQLRGDRVGGREGARAAAGQITSRNNRPLMRVSPRGKTTRDGKVAVERERRDGKQGEEERERNEEALERTQSNTEGDGGTDKPNSSDRSFVAANTAPPCNAAAVSDCKWRV